MTCRDIELKSALTSKSPYVITYKNLKYFQNKSANPGPRSESRPNCLMSLWEGRKKPPENLIIFELTKYPSMIFFLIQLCKFKMKMEIVSLTYNHFHEYNILRITNFRGVLSFLSWIWSSQIALRCLMFNCLERKHSMIA